MQASSSTASLGRRSLAPCFPMRPTDLLRIDEGDDAEVRVQRGSIWLTQIDDHEDHCLEAGATLRLDRHGVALVQALTHAVVCVTWHRATKPAQVSLHRRGRRLRTLPEPAARSAVQSMRVLAARWTRTVVLALTARSALLRRSS